MLLFIRPRDSGGGGPRYFAVERARRCNHSDVSELLLSSRFCSATATKLHLRRPLHHASRGPPPPLTRGRMSACVLAARLCARALRRTPRNPLPPNKTGRRSADRRIQPIRPLRLRPRTRRAGALASRRSTADSSGGRTIPGSAPRPRFLRPGFGGRYPLLTTCLSPASSSRTGPFAGRAVPRVARARGANPPAGLALAPTYGNAPGSRPNERDSVSLSKTVTNVKSLSPLR